MPVFSGCDIINYSLWESRLPQARALGIRPGQRVVTKSGTSKAIRQDFLEKVAALLLWNAEGYRVWPSLEVLLGFLVHIPCRLSA